MERFQQTVKKWLTSQPPADTIAHLQNQLDRLINEYNHQRPHHALVRRTPAHVYNTMPKAIPTTPTDRHYRTRHDIVDKAGTVTLRHAGRLHHINIGRTHTGTPIIMLVEDLNIRIIDTKTGELLRHLTLNPDREYQPRYKNQ